MWSICLGIGCWGLWHRYHWCWCVDSLSRVWYNFWDSLCILVFVVERRRSLRHSRLSKRSFLMDHILSDEAIQLQVPRLPGRSSRDHKAVIGNRILAHWLLILLPHGFDLWDGFWVSMGSPLLHLRGACSWQHILRFVRGVVSHMRRSVGPLGLLHWGFVDCHLSVVLVCVILYCWFVASFHLSHHWAFGVLKWSLIAFCHIDLFLNYKLRRFISWTNFHGSILPLLTFVLNKL